MSRHSGIAGQDPLESFKLPTRKNTTTGATAAFARDHPLVRQFKILRLLAEDILQCYSHTIPGGAPPPHVNNILYFDFDFEFVNTLHEDTSLLNHCRILEHFVYSCGFDPLDPSCILKGASAFRDCAAGIAATNQRTDGDDTVLTRLFVPTITSRNTKKAYSYDFICRPHHTVGSTYTALFTRSSATSCLPPGCGAYQFIFDGPGGWRQWRSVSDSLPVGQLTPVEQKDGSLVREVWFVSRGSAKFALAAVRPKRPWWDIKRWVGPIPTDFGIIIDNCTPVEDQIKQELGSSVVSYYSIGPDNQKLQGPLNWNIASAHSGNLVLNVTD